jgi:hypothetical protein
MSLWEWIVWKLTGKTPEMRKEEKYQRGRQHVAVMLELGQTPEEIVGPIWDPDYDDFDRGIEDELKARGLENPRITY